MLTSKRHKYMYQMFSHTVFHIHRHEESYACLCHISTCVLTSKRRKYMYQTFFTFSYTQTRRVVCVLMSHKHMRAYLKTSQIYVSNVFTFSCTQTRRVVCVLMSHKHIYYTPAHKHNYVHILYIYIYIIKNYVHI